MKYSLLLLLIICSSVISAIVVNHIPPNGYDIDLQTEIRIEIIQGVSDIANASILYRVKGNTNFEQVLMTTDAFNGNWLKGMLPISGTPDSNYEYYFKFVLNNGSVETHPMLEPESNLFVVRPFSKTGEQSDDFILLSDDKTVSAKDGYFLAVSWYALDETIDNSTIRVYVNGKEVTKRAEISNNMLIYKDATPKPGNTSAYIVAKTKDGRNLHSNTWTIKVLSSGNLTTLPMNLRGSVNAGSNQYDTSSDDSAIAFGSDKDDSWTSLEMYADYKKLQLQTYTYLSTLQNEDSQNVNRFRFGMILPYWETYLGDYSPTFTNLTMNNKNLRGVYSKLQTKFFGLSLAHGEMLRSIKGTSYTNTINNQTEYNAGVFKQEALAARLQLGREDGLYMGFTTTRNRDVISSLDEMYVMKQDTIQIAFPKDNLVMSMDARLNVPAQNIVIGIEGAASLYNKNTLPGPLSLEDLEDYIDGNSPIDPSNLQDIFIINTNMQPLPMSKDYDSPRALLAWQAYLRNFWLNNLINMSYSEIGASYKAMSASYLQNDATQWSISDQYTYKQYLFLNAGINQNKDNLSKNNLETNIQDSWYLQGMVRIPQFPYLSLAYSQNKSKNEINDEIENVSLALYNPYKRNSNTMAVGMGYNFNMIPVAPTLLDVSWRAGKDWEDRADTLNVFTKNYENENQAITVSLISRFIEIPLKTQLTVSSNTQERLITDDKNNNFNLLLKGEYRFMQNKLIPWAEYRTTTLGGDQAKQAYNYLTFGLDARPFTNTIISTNLGWQIYSNSDVDDVDYTTTAWHMTINQRF